MFQLPVCPHCHTVYRYGEVKKISKEKEHDCYHCNKKFKVSKKSLWILTLILFVLAVALNVAQLFIMRNLNILALIITNTLLIIIAILFIPYFTEFKEIEDKK